ncbi:MAG: TlpA family protein disulfide reductase [Flavobacteriales bacterium]|nr:TlpA family protein disulfide reductase [Flavobacteriales bacterium]
MRGILTLLLASIASGTFAVGPVTIRVRSPHNAGKAVLLYHYDDLFSLRYSRIATALIDDAGMATVEGEVIGTAKLRIRIGEAFAELYARPGSTYTVEFPKPDPRTPQSINGTTRVELVFEDLDPLDVNAITSDLNDRIDAFIMQDLATDQVAGMQALEVHRKNDSLPSDSVRRPPTLFVMPTWSALRVDTFEAKVKHFYHEVKDPWFDHYLEYSFAGLRYGPRVNDAELFARYLKDKPVVYDDPEYVRFIRSFFAGHLVMAQRFEAPALQRAFDAGDPDSLRSVLAKNEFLKDDPRLCELVMIDLLHQQYHGKVVDRPGAERILQRVANTSAFPEHRTIAANMLWDLTAMRVGYRFPVMLLEDLSGRDVVFDSLLSGPVCVVFTASWCSYCELELQGLEQLHAEYKDVVPIIAIGLDVELATLKAFTKAHPKADFRWLHAVAEQQLRDDLRIKSLPAVYLLNDGVLARSPAPLPSQGLGALFHQAKVEAEKGIRVKVWDD